MRSVVLSVLSLLLLVSWQQSSAQSGARGTAQKEIFASKRAGGIMGRVEATAPYSRLKLQPVFKNRAFCGPSVATETLLVGKDGALRNAVIMLHSVERVVPVEAGRLILDNQRCAFTPHLQVATLGSELLLTNSDPILHTVHARIGKETLFNVGLPKWRQVTKRLDRLGVMRINCDVLHTWMSAVIIVTQTPYFAVSDDNGRFVVDHLPPGQYQMEIWHERLGSKSMRVTLNADDFLSFNIVYGPEKEKS